MHKHVIAIAKIPNISTGSILVDIHKNTIYRVIIIIKKLAIFDTKLNLLKFSFTNAH